jgi:hypothetical protein
MTVVHVDHFGIGAFEGILIAPGVVGHDRGCEVAVAIISGVDVRDGYSVQALDGGGVDESRGEDGNSIVSDSLSESLLVNIAILVRDHVQGAPSLRLVDPIADSGFAAGE